MEDEQPEPAAPGRPPRGSGEKWKVNRAVRASDLAPPARLIMLVLSDIADSGTAKLPAERNPSTAQLARETGHSVSTVKKYRAALQKDGWIVYEPPTLEQRVRHRPGTYKLAVPASERRDSTLGAQGRGLGDAPRITANREPALDPREGRLSTLEPGTEGQRATLATVSSRPSRGSSLDPLSTNDQNNDQKNRAAAAVRESVERVCRHLADRIEANGTPRPPITGAWRDAAAALLYQDGHEEADVHRAIDFAHDDTFWRIHTITPAKLREKWDQIRLSAERARQREQTHNARLGAVPLPPPVEPPNGPVRPAPTETVAAARAQLAESRTAFHAAEQRHRPVIPARPTPPDNDREHHNEEGH